MSISYLKFNKNSNKKSPLGKRTRLARGRRVRSADRASRRDQLGECSPLGCNLPCANRAASGDADPTVTNDH